MLHLPGLLLPEPLSLRQATADPHLLRRPSNTQRQVWLSLLGSLRLSQGPGAHKVLFLPSKSLFPQSCVSFGGSMVRLTFQEGLCHTQVYCTSSPCPCSSPLLTHTLQDTLNTFLSVSVGSLGPFAPNVCFSPLNISGRYGV